MRRMILALAALLLLIPSPSPAADPIFNQAILHETRIIMDPGDWKALRALIPARNADILAQAP